MDAPRPFREPRTSRFFGLSLPDDYAWMRDRDDSRLMLHLEAENAYLDAQMAHTAPLQEQLYEEMLGRIREDDLSVPVRMGEFEYYTRTETGKAYELHCRRPVGGGAEELLLDENELAGAHEFFDLGDLEPSPDGTRIAYSVDLDGSERYTICIKELATGEVLADRIEGCHGGLEWSAGGECLYYIMLDAAMRPFQLWRHRPGSAQADDDLLLEEADPAFYMGISRSKDRSRLFIGLSSMVTTEYAVLDARDPEARPEVLLPRKQGVEYSLNYHEGWYYVLSNENALNFRMYRLPANRGEATELLPHSETDTLEHIEVFRHHLVVWGRRAGLTHFRILDTRSMEWYHYRSDEPVYAVFPSYNPWYEDTEMRFHYSSLVSPRSVRALNLSDHGERILKETEVKGGYDPSQYEMARIFAPAADGREVPVSLLWRKDRRRPEGNPCLMYGYGAYGVCMEPYFSSHRISLLDRGMVFAIAHIRGGGEMGRAWYEEGKWLHKRNSFTDFIAAADALVAQGYTRHEKLAIMGGSAGGLLVGAVLNERPDICRAAVAHVPFVDVINTMSDPTLPLTVVEYEEWGNPAEEAYFKYMLSYSPYENVKAQAYPCLLVTAGLNDPRVSYWEPAKWVARLRELNTGDCPVLMKVNMGAGHQGQSGRYGHLRDLALDYAFVLDKLGVSRRE